MDQGHNALREIPKPGEILAGKYRIDRALAEGGMGVVLAATHIQLEERVAIKFLRPEMLGQGNLTEVTGRFLREARAAIKIRSEHVVRVFDVSALDTGVPYIVMELLDGKDLDQLLVSRGPLPAVEAIDYVLQACEALAEAHALGIIHRDLKPANLFLTQNSSGMPMVKVLDFGISKVGGASGDMSMTSTQTVMGSPLYMSPEQMRATKDADARSDIWAMGVILYELVAGKPPFAGDTMTQVCAAILQDTPKPLGSLRKDVPPGLERIILRCVEKRPADRFASIAELSASLAPFASLVGQESARRTTRSAQFLSSSRLQAAAPGSPNGSSPDLGNSAVKVATAATSTAWGEEHTGKNKKPRSRAPAIAAGVIAALVALGVGGIALMRRAPAPPVPTLAATPPPPVSPASVAPPTIPVASITQLAATDTPPAASAAPTTSAAAPAIAIKPVKKSSGTPATGAAPPKPTATTPKASWNDRK